MTLTLRGFAFDRLNCILRCEMIWLLLLAALVQAQTVPENGSSQLSAEEVLAQTTSAYSDLTSYSAQIACRTLQIVRPNGSATPLDQYQLLLLRHELLTLRVQRPENLYCRMEEFIDQLGMGRRSQPTLPAPTGTIVLRSDTSPPRFFRLTMNGSNSVQLNGNPQVTSNGRITAPPANRLSNTAPPLTEEAFKFDLNNQLIANGNPYFNAFFVPGQPKNVEYAPSFTGEGFWNGQPVYRLKIKRGTTGSEELWISKANFLILRSISLAPNSLVVEAIYQQKPGTQFNNGDFVYSAQPALSPKSTADLGIAEDTKDLLAFVTLPNQSTDASQGTVAAAPAPPATPAAPGRPAPAGGAADLGGTNGRCRYD